MFGTFTFLKQFKAYVRAMIKMAYRVSVALIYDSMNIILSDKLFCLIWILL